MRRIVVVCILLIQLLPGQGLAVVQLMEHQLMYVTCLMLQALAGIPKSCSLIRFFIHSFIHS